MCYANDVQYLLREFNHKAFFTGFTGKIRLFNKASNPKAFLLDWNPLSDVQLSDCLLVLGRVP